MPSTFKTVGVVLLSRDYKEIDRVYTIYTRDYGKLNLRAQGIKKINSKLVGHIEPITETALFIAHAKGYNKIAGANIISSYRIIKMDYEKIKTVNNFFSIINDLILEEQKDEQIYFLIREFLSWLERSQINYLVWQSFFIKLLDHLGYKPDYSQSEGDIAKVFHFISANHWQKIEKLRINQELWEKITYTFNNFLKIHLSLNLQKRNFLL